MSNRVLVVYASRHGSTREVAEEIAAELEAEGFPVDVAAARTIRSVGGYSAVVVGGALYTGRWHKDAVAFLQRHPRGLHDVPLAIYAMGPRTLADHEVAASRAQLDRALEPLHVHPFAVAIFGGVVDPTKLHFPFSRMAAVDARDHAAIQRWAREVGTQAAAARGAPRPSAARP